MTRDQLYFLLMVAKIVVYGVLLIGGIAGFALYFADLVRALWGW